MKATENSIISFFLRYPDYFLKIVSLEYPFSTQQLGHYRDVLDWRAVSQNDSIQWDQDLLNTYADLLDWHVLCANSKAFKGASLIDKFENRIIWKHDCMYATIASNEALPWSVDLIDKYKSKLDFEQLSSNVMIPWSEQLLDKYNDQWDFSLLKENKGLPWSVEFFRKYFNKSDLKSFGFGYYNSNASLVELVEAHSKNVDWYCISASPNLPWHEQNLLKKWRENIDWNGVASIQFLFQDADFFESHLDQWLDAPLTKFRTLSHNKALPWSTDFIDRFSDYWDWEALSQNPSLPWSIKLIKNYENRLVWSGFENQNTYSETMMMTSFWEHTTKD